MLTKKHFKLIAMSIWRSGAIKDKNKVKQAAREKIRHLIATDLASSLKSENPYFNKDKFMDACGF